VSLGEIAWRTHHDLSIGRLDRDRWDQLPEDVRGWRGARAQGGVSRFVSTAIGGAVTFTADEGAELIEYGRLREVVLAELQCPATPAYGTDLAVRIRALIDVTDELLGCGRQGGAAE